MIDEMNERGQKTYVIRSKGGQNGGGTQLTDTGKKVVVAYRKLINKFEAIVKKETEILKLV